MFAVIYILGAMVVISALVFSVIAILFFFGFFK